MPSPDTADTLIILLVSDLDDRSVRECASALTNAGASVETVPDVYAAMARLALGPEVRTLLLDARPLDDKEMSFLRIAHRHHPTVEVLVPSFDGTAERVAAFGAGLQAVDVASIAASVATQTVPSAVAHDDQSSTAALSTEGGPDSVSSGPSLHQSVRQRMAGDDPRVTRRMPPRRPPEVPAPRHDQPEPAPDYPPAELPPPSAAEPARRVLSPEEVDALLADTEGSENDQGPAGSGDAGEVT